MDIGSYLSHNVKVERGLTICRGCESKNLFSALDLGNLPIANELVKSATSKIEKFPLHLKVCEDCGLGQVADVISPERIFTDYRYLSSMSSTFLNHAKDFVERMIVEIKFGREDWVLEIASNDGYLLKNFLPYQISVVGVEPAKNVALISQSLGIDTISEFFGSELARELVSTRGYPKLIIANNVLAHVPDLQDFVAGLEILCGEDTKISIENPTLMNILTDYQFDTIYHEHYSYLSASSISKLSESNGLQLYNVEEVPIHGGSNRYWLRRNHDSREISLSVRDMIEVEVSSGLFNPEIWKSFSAEVFRILSDFVQWIEAEEEGSRKIFGYGAAAKASTFLNSLTFNSKLLVAIADASHEKQSYFMPSHFIEIISPNDLLLQKPTDILIFPWNIKSEIADYLRTQFGDEIRLWCAIPRMHQVF